MPSSMVEVVAAPACRLRPALPRMRPPKGIVTATAMGIAHRPTSTMGEKPYTDHITTTVARMVSGAATGVRISR